MAKRAAAKEPSAARRIADALRAEILDGRIGAGEALPTVRELSIRFEAKGAIIRQALQLLQGEVYVRPGPAGRFYTPSLDVHWMYGGAFDGFAPAAQPDRCPARDLP
ncbi:GntR family transcriptional regulator [Kitasatospora sp. NPDC058162]|uniref:GntR family transcriptional regulator n=1 Tax=Kitasatospora sp. NPDC058162 TaxID=3346362 RepID=UPI0036DD0912